jgi:hypothetical protein
MSACFLVATASVKLQELSSSSSKSHRILTGMHDASWCLWCRYASRIKLIGHREEVVSGMKNEMIELFKLFREKNQGVKPESIVVYRDGVSHGEFKEV